MPDSFKELVDRRINHLLESSSLNSDPELPQGRQLVQDLIKYSSGGKRLRARLFHLSALVHGHPDSDDILDLACALELFQTAALIHDDIIDRSDSRRGEEVAHVTYQKLHTANRWNGDSQHYGLSVALLLGDLCFMISESLFTEIISELPRDSRVLAQEIFTRMRLEVTAGQFLDITAQQKPVTDVAETIDRARQVIAHKTAGYSVRYPLLLGAVIARPNADHTALDRLGQRVGTAFQLRDDLLGIFADEEQTGKPDSSDLLEGKLTVLVGHTLNRLDARAREIFLADFGRQDASTSELDALRETIRNSGAAQLVEAEISELMSQANADINLLDISDEQRQKLWQLLDASVKRLR